MSDQPVAVEFVAELRQIKSTVDHGFIVSLHVGEDGLDQVQALMGMVQDLVRVVLVDETQAPFRPQANGEVSDGSKTRRKRKVSTR